MIDRYVYKISSKYTKTPGPRRSKEGDYPGEDFRRKILSKLVNEAIHDNVKLVIDLDGTEGYSSSFLEESFGGLIRNDHISYKEILEHVELRSLEEPYLIDEISRYLKDADENK